GGIVPAGRALHGRTCGGTGSRDPRGGRPGSARDRNRNRAKAGGETKRRVADEQAAHQTGFHWPAERGCSENRTPGVLRAAALSRSEGSVFGVPREASAEFHESGGRRGRIDPCRTNEVDARCPHTKTGREQRRRAARCGGSRPPPCPPGCARSKPSGSHPNMCPPA